MDVLGYRGEGWCKGRSGRWGGGGLWGGPVNKEIKIWWHSRGELVRASFLPVKTSSRTVTFKTTCATEQLESPASALKMQLASAIMGAYPIVQALFQAQRFQIEHGKYRCRRSEFLSLVILQWSTHGLWEQVNGMLFGLNERGGLNHCEITYPQMNLKCRAC